jgi:pimeloyl-ACP methyl ester carboxylesterase
MRTRAGLLLAILLSPALLAEYAEVRGVKLYYEVHGKGAPVVLLHGGCNTIETSFAKQIPVLAAKYRVIAIEQMAHGHSPDVAGRALSYESMADDTAALLEQLRIRDAALVGWSDGGQVALRMAFTHPHLVGRVVASGVGFGADEAMRKRLAPGQDFGARFAAAFPEGHAAYQRVSPDGPGHWSVLALKSRDMWTRQTWGFTAADLSRIRRPVLLIAGDKEGYVSATVRMRGIIPNAKLLVLPDTGHATFQQRPEWLHSILLDFLSQP